MNLTIGSLELNRTNAAHIGSLPPVDGVISVNPNEKTQVLSVQDQRNIFESFLMDAVNQVNNQQLQVNAIQEQVIADPDSVDIHDVTTAMAKAQMSMNLAQTVIDRLVKGWTELSQNR